MGRKLFCDICPAFYEIALRKEIMRRHVRDFFSDEKYAKTFEKNSLPNIVKSHAWLLVRKLQGVDIKLQENKVTNIKIACDKINGVVIKPGETFSYWKTLGPSKKRYGYKKVLVISRQGFKSGYGGGLCQMANMIHWMVLNSPWQA